jgi:AcrR family transcriptional regulator
MRRLHQEIAAAAGVSRATVFASVGGKAKLLKTALDVAIVGDDEPIALPDRPRSKAIRAEPDARKYLALYAELVTEIDGRLAGIHEAVRGAAGVDSDARALWESHLAQHRQGAANVIGDLTGKGGIRPDLDPEFAADIIWLLGPGAYHMLVRRRGWSPERFQAWLTETFISQLLPAEPVGSQRAASKRKSSPPELSEASRTADGLHDPKTILARVDEPGDPGKPDVGDSVDRLEPRKVVVLDLHASRAQGAELCVEIFDAPGCLRLLIGRTDGALRHNEAVSVAFEGDRVGAFVQKLKANLIAVEVPCRLEIGRQQDNIDWVVA